MASCLAMTYYDKQMASCLAMTFPYSIYVITRRYDEVILLFEVVCYKLKPLTDGFVPRHDVLR
ncbi:hypothetical protein EV196_101549 [Mariniflexile fucanivorans]|uniref:Uncharacterized protein n=1 Tax=Mariniflexile fucanivorans TaxID=264023 RepID=A0A4V2QES2_9FLAO|nr:hypothetical protein [Mariniflexile fucanivorans]TCL69117.1 hypothetical protein EV196_101549 [Mariniflexile fucanivorans]